MKVKVKLWHLMKIFFISASAFIVSNEEKLVPLLVYSSFRRVATSFPWRYSVSITSDNQSHSS